jgi:chromosome segregation ATPase
MTYMRIKYACYFVAIFIAWYIVGCVGTTRRTGADATVLEHQQQITALEDRNQELERRLAQYDNAVGNAVRDLTDIRSRSTGMEDEIDEVISLFDEYQRAVDRLSRAYYSLRDQVKNTTVNSDSSSNNTVD